MPDLPPLTPLAASLPATVPFVGPEAQERIRGAPFRARLGANENGFGPSPQVAETIARHAAEMWKYGDPENQELRQALARRLGVAVENVVVGEGIDGLLGLIVRLYAGPGSAVATSLGAYPTFNFHVAGFGARLITVPYRDDREDLDALLDAARRESAALVYLSNPDNPMGTWWGAADILRFADNLPPATMLILDEAYGETAPPSALPPVEAERPNMLRLRTFSKAYGLAGLRLGYAVGHRQAIRAFDKVRNHFGVNRMAQAAGLVALEDQAHLALNVARIAAARERIAAVAAAEGLKPLPSATNFVTVDCGDGGAFAARVLNALIERDVFVRKPMAPKLDRCIRISAGPEEELDLFASALPDALAAARIEAAA
ncbi:MAG TPA: pyridoxal phosphate-dependent aminotransferase [Mesorhizobium sp.]|jgi:histidinol-phosphate aminotransferase|nr:pyridoxal phosphate-dependent aminotransferase [Mesorhizobium sp.]